MDEERMTDEPRKRKVREGDAADGGTKRKKVIRTTADGVPRRKAGEESVKEKIAASSGNTAAKKPVRKKTDYAADKGVYATVGKENAAQTYRRREETAGARPYSDGQRANRTGSSRTESRTGGGQYANRTGSPQTESRTGSGQYDNRTGSLQTGDYTGNGQYAGRMSSPQTGEHPDNRRYENTGGAYSRQADRSQTARKGRPGTPQSSRDYPMRKKKRKKKGGFGRFLRHMIVFLFILCIICVVGGLALFQYKSGESIFQCISEGMEKASTISEDDFTHAGKTLIYADDGTGEDKVIAELSEDNESTYLTYDEIPEAVIDAFVAVEDRSFWTNSGVNLKGMVRVLVNYVRSGGQTANGASTITQQLVKLTYLSTEKTLARKVKEIVISLELTRKLSDEYGSKEAAKERIMEYYCNTCCFANGIYGIEDASQAYFGTSVGNLTLSQIAYLCAIPNWPEHYNPRTYPENAIERRDKILKDMLAERYISQDEYNAAVSEEIQITSGSGESGSSYVSKIYNYETTYAVNCAVKYIMSQSDDFTFQYSFDNDEEYENYCAEYADAYDKAKHALYTGNYEVYTTLNLEIQDEMQDVVDSALQSYTGTDDEGIYLLQGAMTVIDNDTGKVVSIIGGRSQSEISGIYSLNRGYQGFFQPGSSIKPLVVYAPALDSGNYTSSSLLTNVDVDSAKYMSVSEIQQMSGTQIDMRTAVENSLNGCAYWLFSNIGIGTGISYLHDMGFSKIVSEDYNIGTCLGGLYYGVSTEEMANAYYTLENDGVYTDTDCIESILDRTGTECYIQPESKRVYSEKAARTMTDVLKGVISEGTAAGSYWYSYTSTEAAGKTGTTNENKAAWFCGYTPYYSIAVWVGCDTPTSIDGLQGSSYPLTIWENAMLKLIDGLPAAAFASVDEEDMVIVDVTGCTCTSRCTEDDIDENCPICSADYTQCTADEDRCICGTRCLGDTVNEACPVCLRDPSQCQGQEPVCTCTEKCSADSINIFCPLCSSGDISGCLGAETWDDGDESGDGGESGDTGGDDIWNPTDDWSYGGDDDGTNHTGGSSSGDDASAISVDPQSVEEPEQ